MNPPGRKASRAFWVARDTMSFPHRVRWVLLKEAGLRSDVVTVFLRAVFALQ